MNTNTSERLHFQGLNGLRFFAALFVLIGHVELIKQYLLLPNASPLFERINFGGMGVYFFFVLSGFLITYLLCTEKKVVGTISVKHFYIRRVLRIWPLYYLIVILGFFILPRIDFFEFLPGALHRDFNSNLLLYLLILPNLAFAINVVPVAHIGQAWSIGVEEQFYIFWPLLVKKARNLYKATWATLLIILIVKAVLVLLPHFIELNYPGYQKTVRFIAMCKFESMLIGALGALILFEDRKKLKDLLLHPYSLILSLLCFPFLTYLSWNYGIIQDMIHLPLSLMFLVIMMQAATAKKTFLDLPLIDYLGRISYGIYMYHFAIVFASVKLFGNYFELKGALLNISVYTGAILASLLISHLSYRYFELYFIKLKGKFSKILSN